MLKDCVGHETPAVERALFDFCNQQLGHYKAPGWLCFAAEIPTTGTQKIQKHRIFPEGADTRTHARHARPAAVQEKPLNLDPAS